MSLDFQEIENIKARNEERLKVFDEGESILRPRECDQALKDCSWLLEQLEFATCLVKDLQQESTAFQRGVEAERKTRYIVTVPDGTGNSMTDEILKVVKRWVNDNAGAILALAEGISLSRINPDGSATLLTPARQVPTREDSQ